MNQLDQEPGGEVAESPKKMMQVNLLEGGGYHVEINPSSLLTIQSCPRKSEYSLKRNLVPLQKSIPLLGGNAIHAALEIFYLGKRVQRVLPPNFRENIQRMCHGEVLDDESSFLIYRASRGLINSAKPLAFLEDGESKSIPNMGWLLTEYMEEHINDPYEILYIEGKPMVEALYETVIVDKPKLKITLFGTIDAIMENQATGQIVVCDHKTSGRIDKSFFNRVKPNHQFTAYIHLAQKVLGLTTDEFMVNGFEMKAKPKRETTKGPSFTRILTKRSLEDIEDFIKTTEYYVRQYLGWLEADYFPYGPVDSCSNYGQCTFHEVCSVPGSIRENILDFNYKDKYEKTR